MTPPPAQEGCPLGGTHKVLPWAGNSTGITRRGLTCVRCHKTWVATLAGFGPTHKPD